MSGTQPGEQLFSERPSEHDAHGLDEHKQEICPQPSAELGVCPANILLLPPDLCDVCIGV